MPSADIQATLLGSVPAAFFLRSPLAFSSDLKRIAYIQSLGGEQENQDVLHLANVDGSDDIVMHTGARIKFLGWSPDGQHFAFSDGDPKQGVIAGLDSSRYPLDSDPLDLIWMDDDSILYVVDLGCAHELRLNHLTGESQMIDRMWNFPKSFEAVK